MASPSGTGHDTACPECGTPGGAYLTHVCYAGAVVSRPPPPADPPVAVPGPASVSTADELYLEIRTRDGRLLTQWPILVGEDASEIDVNAEIAWLRERYSPCGLPTDTNAAAILRGDS